MAEMKQVGVREFRDHATVYLSGSDPIAVSKHGRIIGIYVPLERDHDEVRRAIDQFGQTVNQILKETGMNEEELIELLGLNK
jgi:antitoxin (DNA-binding transcriptional repressor) of toxin-antitoxin stability system